MCGLVGFSGVDEYNIEKIKQLLLYNSFARNSKDATGIFTPKTGVIKDNDPVAKFMIAKESEIQPDTTFIGHVRFKTSGGNTKSNAHPFMRKNWVLVHNGTLNNHWLLLSSRSIPSGPINVDSDAVLACIEHDNNFNVLSQIDGAAAFIIYNMEDPETIHIFRNKERELYKGYINSNMYISSEEDALEFIGCNNVKIFKEDHLYTIKSGSIVGEPVKIENKPLKYSYTTVTNDKKVNKKVAGCNLRATTTCKVGHRDGMIQLEKDEYYNIVGNSETGIMYEIRDPNNWNKTSYAQKSLFNHHDILSKGDMVMTLHDIRLKKGNKLVFNKGTIHKIIEETENEIEVDDPSDNTSMIIYKQSVRKLTAKELIDYYENMSISTRPKQDEAPFRFPGLHGIPFTVEAEDVDTEVVDEPVEEVKLALYITKKEILEILPDHFKLINNLLDSVETRLCETSVPDIVVMRTIRNVIGMNTAMYNKMFKKIDNANV